MAHTRSVGLVDLYAMLSTSFALALGASFAYGQNRPRLEPLAVQVLGNYTPAEVESHLDEQLELCIESIHRSCRLTAEQQEKLRFAGQGDIKRFLDEVSLFPREDLQLLQRAFGVAPQIANARFSLQRRFDRGIFDDQSLLRKSLKRVLDASQLARYEQAEEERRRFRHQASVESFVATLATDLALQSDQRAQFVQVLLEETKSADQGDALTNVMFQAERIPEEKLRGIFDDAQWQALQQWFAQVRQIKPQLILQWKQAGD